MLPPISDASYYLARKIYSFYRQKYAHELGNYHGFTCVFPLLFTLSHNHQCNSTKRWNLRRRWVHEGSTLWMRSVPHKRVKGNKLRLFCPSTFCHVRTEQPGWKSESNPTSDTICWHLDLWVPRLQNCEKIKLPRLRYFVIKAQTH